MQQQQTNNKADDNASSSSSSSFNETNILAPDVASASYCYDTKQHLSVLTDGVVLLKNYIPLAQQQIIIDYLIPFMENKVEGVEGLDDKPNPNDKRNTKGFVDIPRESFSNSLAHFLCDEPLRMAREANALLGKFEEIVKLVQVCYYTTKGKLGWHRDRIAGLSDEEQDKLTSPVISISIGDDCKFEYKHSITGTPIKLKLNSGDILIFGGPMRMMWHAVTKIYNGTAPAQLNLRNYAGRFNMTFREGTYYPPNIAAQL